MDVKIARDKHKSAPSAYSGSLASDLRFHIRDESYRTVERFGGRSMLSNCWHRGESGYETAVRNPIASPLVETFVVPKHVFVHIWSHQKYLVRLSEYRHDRFIPSCVLMPPQTFDYFTLLPYSPVFLS